MILPSPLGGRRQATGLRLRHPEPGEAFEFDRKIRIAGRLPAAGSGPTDSFRHRLTLRAYGHDESIRDAALVAAEEAAETVERFLESSDVAFAQARFPTYGCFACRIERAS